MPVRVLLLAFCVTFLAVALRDGHGTENPTTVPKRERIVNAKSLVIPAHRNGTIHLENAIIRGPLNLSYLTIDQQVLLVNCEFEDRADFSYATFKRDLDLHNSTFNKGFNFRAATVELNGIFNDLKVLFEPSEHKSMETQEADLRYFHVKGVFQMQDAVDSASTNFAHAQFDKDVDLRGSVFGENAVLTEMQVGGDLFCRKSTL